MTGAMGAGDWRPFVTTGCRASAETVAALLESEDVPTIVRAKLVAGVESGFRIFVPSSLVHRARWVLAQYDFCDAELEYLATGALRDDHGRSETSRP